MLIRIVLLLIAIFSLDVHANQLKAIIGPYDKNETSISLGLPFKAHLFIYPVENFDYQKIYSMILKNEFSEFLRLISVDSAKISENNHDVLDVVVLLALVKVPNVKNFYLKVDDATIWSELREFSIKEGNISIDPQGKYLIAIQGFSPSLNQQMILLFCLIIFITLYFLYKFYVRKIRPKRMEKKRMRELRLKWFDVMTYANDRKAYEYIYLNKNEWSPLVKNPAVLARGDKLVNLIGPNLYKEHWEEAIYIEAKNIVEEIKSGINA